MKAKKRSNLLELIIGVTGGITIGLIISLVFSYLYGRIYYPSTPAFMDQFSNPLNALGVSILIWGLMGVVFSLGSLVFRQETWGITRQTVVHFVITYIGFTSLALVCRWFPLNVTWLIIYTLIFVLIYLIMWTVDFAIAKRNVRQINEQLKRNSR